MKIKLSALLALALCYAVNSQLSTARAQGSAFSYQGRLNTADGPANGSYDLTFTLFNTNAGGTLISGPVTNSAVSVSNGLFTVAVDFGGAPFTLGQALWLEIGARTNSTATFSTLAPRQAVLSTPIADYALTVNASSLIGQVTDANLATTFTSPHSFNNAADSFTGNGSGLTALNGSQITSGTVSDARLSSNVALLNANQTFTGSNNFSASGILGSNTLHFGVGIAGQEANAGKIGYEVFSPDALDIVGASTVGNPRKIQFWAEAGANFNGSVGIGTNNPHARLQIVGAGNSDDAKLMVQTTGGTFGPQLRLNNSAPGGEEWVFVADGTINGPVGALQIVQSSSGAARMLIATNGNVGIGTTTPQLPLDISSFNYAVPAAQFGVANCGGPCGQTNWQEAVRLWNQNNNGQVGLGFLVGPGSFNSNAVPDVWIGTAYGAYSVDGHANDFQIATTTNSIGTNLINRVYVNGTSGNVGIGTTTPNSDSRLQVNGMVRMGSETGTSEAPNRSILVRRVNSTSSATGQVLARSSTGFVFPMTLERDGTSGGLILKIAASAIGSRQIVGFGITASGATVNVYDIGLGGNSTTQIFTDAQRIGYCRLTFGDPLNNSELTTVELMRAVDTGVNNDLKWIGTVTSTVNQ